MKKSKIYLLGIIAAILTLFSCDKDNDASISNPLTANAGEDKQTTVGVSITLDGSASKDLEGEAFEYYWNLKSKPAGSTYNLKDAQTATPDFTANTVGTYIVELEIRKDNWKDKDEVQIVVSEVATQEMVIISEDINADIILYDIFPEDPTKVDYLITKPIKSTAKLTIDPGVRVAFSANAALTIASTGTFISVGEVEEEKRVYLEGQNAIPGFWTGIQLQSGNDQNIMKYTVVNHAGGQSELYDTKAALWMDDFSKLRIENSVFKDNDGLQLYAKPEAHFNSFVTNYFLAVEEIGHAIAVPAHEVENITPGNQFWNGDIAVTTTFLDNGETINWGQYFYTLLEDLKVINGTTLQLPQYVNIRVSQDKQIALMNGGAINATGADGKWVEFKGVENVPGYWKGIFIQHSGNNPSVFKYAVVQNAGSSPLAGDQPASIHLGPYGVASIDYSNINFGGGDGIEATSEGASITSFVQNQIRGQAGYPMAVSTKNVSVIDHDTWFSNNGIAKVRVDGNYPIASDEETFWPGFMFIDMSYHIKGLGKDLVVWSGLKLAEGVIIEMENESRIVVEDANGRQGYINAIGSADKHIVIKNTDEIAGSWYGITFSNLNTSNHFDFVEVLHGGKKVANSFSANITIDNSPEGKLTISNSIIGQSGQHGISVFNTQRGNLVDSNITYLDIPESTVYIW
ncbi:hypothetical protein SAMN04487891_107224 [Flagellimonas taeanensis]|uniref:Right handed beta helix region n=1 Tax=Flagellimonas taeanensis TaxID=1005926 RepID=A0A1M6UUN6_9FLAO|nr:hypothetical protein [Allomuricauda taeanensis]SFC23392.1 hypothetical protein SAMN04487891_107224 [Allomuricauda taeanensis]SHK72884.1 hypothetical protein SAMN05216293_1781 [Allomuricauda taeanensis]